MDWVMMNAEEAQRNCAVVMYDEDGFCPESVGVLEDFLQRWAQAMKEKHPGQMLIATLREAGMDMARTELLQEALACKKPCLAVPLLPDLGLVLTRPQVLKQLGRRELVSIAHANSMELARKNGQPYNADALAQYEHKRQQEHN